MHNQITPGNTTHVATHFGNSQNVSRHTMSSREIAELTGKQHKHVKVDVEKMLADLEEDTPSFRRIYLDSMNREQTEYLLDREHTDCLLTGYSAAMRMAVIKRWRELEGGGRVIATLPDFSNPAAAARAWAEQYELQQATSRALAVAAPKVAFVDRYVVSTGLLGFRQVAKLLKANERELKEMLLSEGIMYYLGKDLTPKQEHIAAGRFEMKAGTSSRNSHSFTITGYTPKGVEWVAGKWAAYTMRRIA